MEHWIVIVTQKGRPPTEMVLYDRRARRFFDSSGAEIFGYVQPLRPALKAEIGRCQ